MGLLRIGWDRIVGASMLAAGLIISIVATRRMFAPTTPDDVLAVWGEPPWFALGVLLLGWSLPLLVHGKARHILVVVLAVETPFVLLIAWSWGRGLHW